MSTRPPDLSDLELLRVWRVNGDDGAFHVLVLRHFDPVVNFVRGYVGRDLAADIAQNAFLRLVERADELLAAGAPPAGAPPQPTPVAEPLARSLRGWLLRVARN